MSDTTVSAPAAVPSWLTAAVEQYEKEQLDIRASQIMHRESHAEHINDKLASLGIEPLQPARLNASGYLEGAVLVRADPEADTYEVRAFWDEESGQVELHTADWDGSGQFRRVRLLNRLADVAAAHHETPKAPAPARRNFAAEALRAIDSLNVDRLNDGRTEAIVTAINGLTAAVLHAARP
ncbi:hypothetical protein [Streptomyces yangpuensis]|uniref:hypothetical protein n=1 Tax=Streptomyces yangpuensis TaxID=1648182 RepID=UPI00365C3899